MANSFTDDDNALLAELGVEVDVKKLVSRTPREERIIAGFEEILRVRRGAWSGAPTRRRPRYFRTHLCGAPRPDP